MAPGAPFQRARRPHQKAQRRALLLDAATRLLDAHGLEAVSLAAVAREARITKSNVYRYFESREAIFLELLLADQTRWVAALERALAPLHGCDDAGRTGRALARTLAAEPRLCALVAALALVLETNLSDEAVHAFKREVQAQSLRIAGAVQGALPSLPAASLAGLTRALHALVAGLWPMAHPAPAVRRALADPELASFRCDFAADLEAALVALLRGLAASG